MTKHAVVDDHNDYYRITSQEESLVEYAPTVEELYDLMQARRIDVLWAMPGCSFSKNIRREHFPPNDAEHYVPEHTVRNRMTGARIGKKFFMFPENREWKQPQKGDKGVWHVENANDLLATIQALESEYKVPVLWGPAHIGLETFHSIHQFSGLVVSPLGTDQQREFLGLARQMASPLSWANLHSRGKFVVGVDKNAQFTGAAQSVMLGNGVYERVAFPMVYVPSFIHYKASLPTYYNPIVPLPIPVGEGWASNDLMGAALKMGMNIQILGCIYWEQQGKYLEQWAKEMWQHRANLTWKNVYLDEQDERATKNAASTAKMIPNTLVGRLKNEGLPHWNMAIIHRAIANQAHTLHRLYRDEEIAPVLVSKDALYFVTDEEDPYKALPTLLQHEHEQRGYKLIGVCELTSEIEAAFERVNDRRFGVGGIEGVIRKAMRG